MHNLRSLIIETNGELCFCKIVPVNSQMGTNLTRCVELYLVFYLWPYHDPPRWIGIFSDNSLQKQYIYVRHSSLPCAIIWFCVLKHWWYTNLSSNHTLHTLHYYCNFENITPINIHARLKLLSCTFKIIVFLQRHLKTQQNLLRHRQLICDTMHPYWLGYFHQYSNYSYVWV